MEHLSYSTFCLRCSLHVFYKEVTYCCGVSLGSCKDAEGMAMATVGYAAANGGNICSSGGAKVHHRFHGCADFEVFVIMAAIKDSSCTASFHDKHELAAHLWGERASAPEVHRGARVRWDNWLVSPTPMYDIKIWIESGTCHISGTTTILILQHLLQHKQTTW